MKMKKLISVVTAVIMTSFVLSPTSAEVLPEENFYPSVKQEPGWLGATFQDAISNAGTSFLYSTTGFKPNATPDEKILALCHAASESPCSDLSKGLMFRSVFAPCKAVTDTDCIEQFRIKNQDGTVSDGTFTHEWKENSFYIGDSKLGLPDGHGTGTWSVTQNGKSVLYGLVVGVEGSRNPYSGNVGKVVYDRFFASVQPVVIKNGGYQAQNPNVTHRADGDGPGWNTGFIEQGCELVEQGVCAYRQSFDLNDTASLTVRLGQPIQGWLHGRLKEANISIKSNPDSSQVISIDAKALTVPSVLAWARWNDLPQTLKDLYPVGSGGTARTMSDFTTTDLANRTLLAGPGTPAGERAIRELGLWTPFMSDKATAMRTLWTIHSISGDFQNLNSSCLRNIGFTGVIGTNAAVYSDGPPTFDKQTSSLNYTVGAPHFDSSGKVFDGFYQINLRSDVARCLYGFSSAPIQAKIDVASSDGSNTVAATTVSETNGWLNLTAGGFHYSTPTINVKLTQEAPVVAQVNPTLPSAPSLPAVVPAIKKITITCIKGKATKKVTALKPTCPTGYKKK